MFTASVVYKNRFPQLRKAGLKAVEKRIEKTAKAIVRDLESGPHRAPKRSGALRRSYSWRWLKRGPSWLVLVFTPLPYAVPVEFGHRAGHHGKQVTARPSLRPAAAAEKRVYPQEMADALKDALR